jgi:hypothetical protein
MEINLSFTDGHPPYGISDGESPHPWGGAITVAGWQNVYALGFAS